MENFISVAVKNPHHLENPCFRGLIGFDLSANFGQVTIKRLAYENVIA